MRHQIRPVTVACDGQPLCRLRAGITIIGLNTIRPAWLAHEKL
jgi:hypothetical protein